MTDSWPYVVFALLAFALSLAVGRLMLSTGIGLSADVPNDRSMHGRIIPRGGGLAFAASTVVAALAARFTVFQSGGWLWYVVPLALMAVLGWLDDRFGLGIATRFTVQVGAAALSALFLLEAGDMQRSFGAAYVAWFSVVVIGMVWVTNLYNFMDGMDGLAGGHAVVVLATMAIWFAARGASAPSLLCTVLAAAVAAFLTLNWHPARVFMGDTGSLSLGITIAALSFGGIMHHGLPAAAFILLMATFLFDATFTLLRRMLRGERWWQSHRSHLYQRAEAIGISQPRIVAAVILMDLVLAVLASLLVFEKGGVLVLSAAGATLLMATMLWVGREEARATRGATPK